MSFHEVSFKGKVSIEEYFFSKSMNYYIIVFLSVDALDFVKFATKRCKCIRPRRKAIPCSSSYEALGPCSEDEKRPKVLCCKKET